MILDVDDPTFRRVISLAMENANLELAQSDFSLEIKTEILKDNLSFNTIKKGMINDGTSQHLL